MISIVIPVYNEEEVLSVLFPRLSHLIEDFLPDKECEIIFVDDGSSDGTLQIINEQAMINDKIKIISFSRNFGHQIALTAGIEHASGDYVAIIDGDLQDPPELISKMYKKAISNNLDVVYGKRKKRKGESIFKKVTASFFYRSFCVPIYY